MFMPPSETSARSSATEKALRWQLRKLDSGRWSNSDEAALAAWLSESAIHREEFAKLEKLTAQMSNPAAYAPGVITATRAHHATRAPRRRALLYWGSGAMAIAAVIVLFFGLSFWLSPWEENFSTAIAEKKSLTLPDGSRVEMDADTRLAFSFNQSRRTVQLLQGKAIFQVTPDKNRPFEVVAAQRMIRVVGTRFEVAQRDSLAQSTALPLQITLQEGIIELYSRNQQEIYKHILRLQPGQQANWSAAEEFPAVRTISLQSFGAWQQGRLVYQGEPLASVLADLQRAFPVTIELRDPSLARIQFNGTLSSTNLSETLALLQSALPLRVTEISPQQFTIAKRIPSSPAVR